jgi:hypothetical protein
MENQESIMEAPFDVEKITANNINMEGMEDMENIENIINISSVIPTTFTQSNNVQSARISISDTYKVQSAHNRSLKIFALNILKYLPKGILRKELDFSSFKTNEAIPDNGLCRDYDMSIFSEDLPRSLVINVCDNVIHQTCTNKVDNRGALPCSCDMIDDNDLF